jgi:putative secretion ATPase (PEP-CTERM system associated)
MYTEFYKLSGMPFQLTPDHRFYFGSSNHTRAMAHLTYGLHQGEGFIVITGEVGAGKTTMVGHLLSTLDKSRYVAANVVTTQLGPAAVLRMVAQAFHLPAGASDKATLLQRLEYFLRRNDEKGRRCLLIVDEAQNLQPPAIEELRMLSNFQVEQRALLQSFILGQPQFRRTLASPDLAQFRQRVIASYHLGPMNEEETGLYIMHRLRMVGWDRDPMITDDAFRAVFRATGGVPRMINNLCSRLLLFGYLETKHLLNQHDVAQVAEDLARDQEEILDHGVEPPRPEPRLVDHSHPVAVDDFAPAKALPSPVEPAESSERLQDKTLKRALQVLSDHLNADSTLIKRERP